MHWLPGHGIRPSKAINCNKVTRISGNMILALLYDGWFYRIDNNYHLKWFGKCSNYQQLMLINANGDYYTNYNFNLWYSGVAIKWRSAERKEATSTQKCLGYYASPRKKRWICATLLKYLCITKLQLLMLHCEIEATYAALPNWSYLCRIMKLKLPAALRNWR